MIEYDGSYKRQGQVRETLESDKHNQVRYRVIRRLPCNAKRPTICQTASLNLRNLSIIDLIEATYTLIRADLSPIVSIDDLSRGIRRI